MEYVRSQEHHVSTIRAGLSVMRQLIVIRYILCSILEVEEGDDKRVLPDDIAMYDGDSDVLKKGFVFLTNTLYVE